VLLMKSVSFYKMLAAVFVTMMIIGGLMLLVFLVVLPRLRDIPALAGIRANTLVVDFHTHFSLDPDVPQLIFDGRRLRDELPPLVAPHDGGYRVYLRVGFLRNYVDPFVFWDEGAGVLFFSSLYEMMEFSPDSEYFLLNGSPRPVPDMILVIDGEVFVPDTIVQGLYPLSVEFRAEYNMVVVTDLTREQTTAVAAGTVDVRYWASERAPITARLSRGDTLLLFIGDDEYDTYDDFDRDYDFVRVRTHHGLLGYVSVTDIEGLNSAVPLDSLQRDTILGGFLDNMVHHPRVWSGGGGINLIWESVYHPDANMVNMLTPLDSSVNVVSPTWFRIDPYGTRLNSVASREYVDWAHSQGVLVWPLVFDVRYERSRLFLTDRNARRYAINQLIEYVGLLNLDGINIDFEHLTAAEGPYKIQFLRELNIPMRQRGIVLSAAVKVPLPATAFYRRDLIGKTVDFVMVMTYDEHWATSPVAGPNASLPWVRRGVDNMLREVPRDRLVMGLPFYNRVWREVVSTGAVSHHGAMGTNTTRAFFEERGVTWVWDFEIGSYFGEVPAFEDGETVIYRVWLEDARSIGEKMHIFSDNNLAGVASWNRLFAIDEFWEVLGRYF
jgi:spore germination protein YaaH